MTESDRCEEREPYAATLFNFINRTPTSEYGCGHMMAYEEGFLDCSGDYVYL